MEHKIDESSMLLKYSFKGALSENKMNTLTNAYLTKFSSGTILALLALSGVLFLIPLAAPVNAAQNASFPTLVPNFSLVTGHAAPAAFTVTVTNPSTNAYPITSITFVAPANWNITGTAATCATGWTATNSGATSATAVLCAGGSLAPGFSILLKLGSLEGPRSPAASPAITQSFTTSLIDGGTSGASYGGPTMSVTSTAATSVSLVTSSTTFTAGGSALTLTATISPVQQSVPLAFSTAAGTGGAGTVSATSGTTDSTGKVTLTIAPSNTLGTGTATAKLALPSACSGATCSTVTIQTFAGVPSTVTFTGNLAYSASKFYNATTASVNPLPSFDPTVKYATVPAGLGGVTASAGDAFGNGITWDATPTCTFLAFGGLFDNGGGVSGSSDTVTGANCTTTSTKTDKAYYQASAYGTSGYLQASVSGMYLGTQYAVSGLTRNIFTSVFDSAANTPTFTVTSPQKAG